MSPRLIVVCRVTTVCNLTCGFCAYDRRLPFARSTLADAQIERLIELMADWHRRRLADKRAPRPVPGAPLLSWLGGEPLLWRGWVRGSALARARGLAVSATTNATTLGQVRTREQVLQHLDELTVSVDAVGAAHDALRGWPGGYARTLAAVHALADERARLGSGLRLRANVVLMRSTIDGFAALTAALAGAGVDEISFNLLGGRDRPAFHAVESVPPVAFDRLARQLPALRRQLAQQGVALIGSDDYAARLGAASRGQAWPVADCAAGSQFLFVDEHARIAPCAFTGVEYGIPLADVRRLDELAAVFAGARRHRCAQACGDCPSTQVFGKFAGDVGVVDSRAQDVVDAGEWA